MRLRAHLIIFAIAILLPIIVLVGISFKEMRDDHRNTELNNIHNVARIAALNVDRDLNGVQSSLRVLSSSASLKQGLLAQFHEEAKIASQSADGWIILYASDGQQLINTRIPYGDPLPKRAVNLERFEQIKNSDTPHVSNLMWGDNAKRYVIMVEMPFTINSNKYVLSQAIPQEYFNRAIAGSHIPSNWIAGVVDRDGTTIARSKRPQDYVGKQGKYELVEAIKNNYQGVLQHTSRDGIKVYTVITSSSLSNLVIAVGAPSAEIDEAVFNAGRLAVYGLLVAIVVAAILGTLIGRRVLRSVNRVVDDALSISQGSHNELTPESGIKEINELYATINHASEVLEQEKAHRLIVEADRNRLLVDEKKARKYADDQNRAKDQFLAMLGHELRNPLAAITSAIDVMEHGQDKTFTSRAHEIIRRQGANLNNIVSDLLDVSRVLSGKVLLNRTIVDFSEIVGNCIQTFHTTGRTNGHSVSFSSDQPIHLNADSTRIEQVFNNLLDNAVKYTPHGGSILVDLRYKNNEAVLTVQDSGIGISEELLPNVFDVFVQGDSSLDRARGGLGVGLALVRQLIELHDGTISCESDGAGKGSKFIVCFPRIQNVDVGQLKNLNFTKMPRCKVLLIDDHEDARQMTTAMLEKYGHQVFQASNGTNGIKIASMVKPDIALIDIGMPILNGYDTALQIRHNPSLDQMRLIALTGYGLKDDVQKSLDSGFDMHLTKPLTMEKFNGALAELWITAFK